MNLSRIIVAFILLLTLASGYYYLEVVPNRQKLEANNKDIHIFSFDPAKITAIAIHRPGEETIEIKKDDGKWQIREPLETNADHVTVERIIYSAASLTSVMDIGDIEELAAFGLDKPRKIIFTTKENKNHTLNIGGKNYIGARYYVTSDTNPQVRMVNVVAANPLIKNLHELRDRRLIVARIDEITSVVITNFSTEIVIAKTEPDTWRLTKPIDAPAKRGVVEAFLDELINARVSGFMEEERYERSKYGLDSPDTRIVIEQTSGEKIVISYGDKTPGGRGRYAMVGDNGPIVRVPENLYRTTPQSTDDLRALALFSFAVESVSKIVIERDEDPLELESNLVTKEDEQGEPPEIRWRFIKPENEKADSSAVSTTLNRIGQAVGIKIITEDGDPEKYHLDKPELSVTIYHHDKSVKSVRVAKAPDDVEGKYFFAQVEGFSAIYLIDDLTHFVLNPSLHRLKDRKLFGKFRPDEVFRIVVRRMGQKFDVRKVGDRYEMVSPDRRVISANSYHRLLWTIVGIRYNKKLEKPDIEGVTLDFAKPLLSVMVYNKTGMQAIKMSVADIKTKNDRYPARIEGDATLYQISEMFVNEELIAALEAMMNDENS